MIAHDRITGGVIDESVAVMHTGVIYHQTPCQLVKIPLKLQKDAKTKEALSVPISFYCEGFINCFMVENNRTILVTAKHLTLLDDKFNQMISLTQDALHKDVDTVYYCEHIQSAIDKT